MGTNWPECFCITHAKELRAYWSRSLEEKRGKAVNPTTNAAWWSLYTSEVEKYGITAETLYTCDETGLSTGQGTQEHVIGGVGKKTQHQIRGGNRENITVLVVIAGDGRVLLPLVVFKGDSFLVSWDQPNPTNTS